MLNSVKEDFKKRCPHCGGSGLRFVWHTGGRDEHSCPRCGGGGWVPTAIKDSPLAKELEDAIKEES